MRSWDFSEKDIASLYLGVLLALERHIIGTA
jgi:hypothetical protein